MMMVALAVAIRSSSSLLHAPFADDLGEMRDAGVVSYIWMTTALPAASAA